MIYADSPGKSTRIDVPTITAIAIFAIYLLSRANIPIFEGDSVALVQGAQAALRCWNESKWGNCPSAIHFPALQVLPSVVLIQEGWSAPDILKFLGRISLLMTGLTFFMGFRFLARRVAQPRAWLYVLTLATSYLLWYANSTFAESLAASLTLFFTLAAIERSPWIAIWAALVCISKDTAWPFVLILGVTCVRSGNQSLRSARGAAAALGVGTSVGVAFNCAFNWFRFGSIWNSFLLDESFRTPTLADTLSFLSGLIVSPNAGLLFFSPLFSVLFFGSIIAGLRNAERKWFWISLGGLFVLLCAGFSKWFAPFGWVAWGPRLLLPWVPALLIATLVHSDRDWRKLPRSALLVFGILGLIHFLAGFDRYPLGWFFSPSELCPRMAVLQEDPAYYYQCMHHATWPMVEGRYLLPQTLAHNLRGRWFWAIAYVIFVVISAWKAGLMAKKSRST